MLGFVPMPLLCTNSPASQYAREREQRQASEASKATEAALEASEAAGLRAMHALRGRETCMRLEAEAERHAWHWRHGG
jgi:hypothetical protein